MYETEQIVQQKHSPMQRGNAFANRGGAIPLTRSVEIPEYKCLIRTRCIDCGEISGEFTSLSELLNKGKRYCLSCKKKRKYKQVSNWNKKNPKKVAEYQQLKNIRRKFREGKEPRTLIYKCQLCGNDISDKPNAVYCDECRNDIRLFKDWYHAEEIEGREIFKKSLIKNCIICGKDISMLTGQDIYCCNCKPSRNFHNLGTTDFGKHMKRRRYGVPNFEAELRTVENQMKHVGLEPIKHIDGGQG